MNEDTRESSIPCPITSANRFLLWALSQTHHKKPKEILSPVNIRLVLRNNFESMIFFSHTALLYICHSKCYVTQKFCCILPLFWGMSIREEGGTRLNLALAVNKRGAVFYILVRSIRSVKNVNVVN